MIVVDTHVAVWIVTDASLLSAKARKAIDLARREELIGISTVTLLEVAHAIHLRRIQIAGSPLSFLKHLERQFAVIPIDSAIAWQATQFDDRYPKDPIDRIIGSTALVNRAGLVTADQNIRKSGAFETIW
jgi:PIN domain nuclease of toxin-antitoxin system